MTTIGRPLAKVDPAQVEQLARFAFDYEQIGSVFGRTADEMEAEYGALIRAVWPEEPEYVRRRVCRLLRHAGPHREAVRRAYAHYRGVRYYPLQLSARVYIALRSHVIGMCVRAQIDSSTVTRRALEDAWGYRVSDVMEHLASLFRDGMRWGNWGDWHIDHIRPRASFNIGTIGDEAFRRCWALSNLQPLWAADNTQKGARVK